MSTDKTYNGWSNYETWNVKLWLDNEQSSYSYWQEATREAIEEASEGGLSAYAKLTGTEIFTPKERAILTLERRLKEEIENDTPDLGASMWSDLLNAALSEVDWHEIATSMIEDEPWPETAEQTEEEEEA